MTEKCIVLLTNKKFLQKTLETLKSIRTVGQYLGDVVIVVGDDLEEKIFKHIAEMPNTFIKYFPTKKRKMFYKLFKKKPIGLGTNLTKPFQLHKIYLFSPFFKRWNKCLYIDSGMKVFQPLDRFWDLDCTNKLLANSDAYPTYERTLGDQFDRTKFSSLYNELDEKYDLSIDYFQSTMMLYDTSIIKDYTLGYLETLTDHFINTLTNDQAILNLLFNCEEKVWEQIPIRDELGLLYDFMERDGRHCSEYVMVKYPRTSN